MMPAPSLAAPSLAKDELILSTYRPGNLPEILEDKKATLMFCHSHPNRDEIAAKINKLNLKETLDLMEQVHGDIRYFEQVLTHYSIKICTKVMKKYESAHPHHFKAISLAIGEDQATLKLLEMRLYKLIKHSKASE